LDQGCSPKGMALSKAPWSIPACPRYQFFSECHCPYTWHEFQAVLCLNRVYSLRLAEPPRGAWRWSDVRGANTTCPLRTSRCTRHAARPLPALRPHHLQTGAPPRRRHRGRVSPRNEAAGHCLKVSMNLDPSEAVSGSGGAYWNVYGGGEGIRVRGLQLSTRFRTMRRRGGKTPEAGSRCAACGALEYERQRRGE
jgi:hypothetical protein